MQLRQSVCMLHRSILQEPPNEIMRFRRYSPAAPSPEESAAAKAVTRPTTFLRMVCELIRANATLRSRPSLVSMKLTSSGAAAATA